MGTADEVEKLAAAGDVEALTQLGKEALVGRAGPRTPEDGARLLLTAAEKGSAEADALIAVLIAVDARETADWSLALGYLQRAAERGWAAAREQLGVLAADREIVRQASMGEPDSKTWERLRDTIDIASLLKPLPICAFSDSPRIGVIEKFAREAECNWMIARGRSNLKRAEVFDQSRGGRLLDNSRTNSATLFGFLDMDVVLALLRARLAHTAGFARTSLEETNVLHYAIGQEFSRHFDYYDPSREANAAEIAAKGQRVGTFLIYLNEGFDGGETEFAMLDRRYKGSTGDGLFFMNVDESGRPDPRTMHAGSAPTRGEKWLLSQWIRGVPGAGL